MIGPTAHDRAYHSVLVLRDLVFSIISILQMAIISDLLRNASLSSKLKFNGFHHAHITWNLEDCLFFTKTSDDVEIFNSLKYSVDLLSASIV